MLVLTRRENESIRIGDDIFISVTQIQGNRVRFAIEAPKEIRIVRGELQMTTSVAEVPTTLVASIVASIQTSATAVLR
ncbi:carbon storage regulator [Rubripirellula reticaptiva]|uniref:Translational regulator CsrA n=1 Tax=Rubripirellula reticaptiva TaxID=2528013 RepID=A0A5C6F5X8_9BACT|nr:carbon storage regulator [Rubripirellula reticaptiva]TWU57103.1 hypothetical protein Poly59_00080 [Rubripirellula reticaptiva]